MELLLLHLFCIIGCLLPSLLWISAAQSNNEPFAMRISCGAREDTKTKTSDTLWYRDFGYTGGKYANATTTSFIAPVLPTLRYFPLSDGPENCYNLNSIPNGHYEVRLFFALIDDPNLDTEPIFDVSIDGTLIYSLSSGWSTNDEECFAEAFVFVTDSTLSICFHSTGHGDPSVLSIEALQVDDKEYYYGSSWGKSNILRTVRRLTCGSGKPAFDEDYDGNHWGGDRYWQSIQTFDKGNDKSISTESKISKASVAPNYYPEAIYQSAIVGSDLLGDLSFQFEVDPNTNYSLWLHFAEIGIGIESKGQRIFDVVINGDVVFQDLDIVGESGGSNTALVLNTTIAMSGRSLMVQLRAKNNSQAIISAIELFEIIQAESQTSANEVSALQVLKKSLGLPQRFGWNGDPCVPQQHPWSGIDCHFDSTGGNWVIDGLGLDNQGLKGFLPDEISKLQHLQSINLSDNSIYGPIPWSLGTIAGLEILDLSFNQLNGSIPDSLGNLTMIQILNLNGNLLSGRVPASLGGMPVHRASFNFTGNAGLCGIPGLRPCGPHLSIAAKLGIAFGVLLAILLILICVIVWWKRRENILRAQKIAAAREAPYAKARTHFQRDVQMAKHQRSHDQARNHTETTPLS